MDAIKAKMSSLETKLEEANKGANAAEAELQETIGQAETVENEVEELKKELKGLEDELDKVESELYEKPSRRLAGQKLSKYNMKMAEFSRKIDEAHERKATARGSLIVAKARLEKAEVEHLSVQHRIKSIRADLGEAESRLREARKAKQAEKEGKAIEAAREELREAEGDEVVTKLEAQAEEIHHNAKQLDVLTTKCLAELEEHKAILHEQSERREHADARVKELETDVMAVGNSLRSMELQELEASERIGATGRRLRQTAAQAEEQVKEALSAREEAETKNVECARKLTVVKRDVDTETAKADALEKRVEVLEKTIQNANDSLKDLEEREGESSMKEERLMEQLTLLEGQFKEVEVRFEAAERGLAVCRRNLDEERAETRTWQQKTQALDKEMDEMDAAGRRLAGQGLTGKVADMVERVNDLSANAVDLEEDLAFCETEMDTASAELEVAKETYKHTKEDFDALVAEFNQMWLVEAAPADALDKLGLSSGAGTVGRNTALVAPVLLVALLFWAVVLRWFRCGRRAPAALADEETVAE